MTTQELPKPLTEGELGKAIDLAKLIVIGNPKIIARWKTEDRDSDDIRDMEIQLEIAQATLTLQARLAAVEGERDSRVHKETHNMIVKAHSDMLAAANGNLRQMEADWEAAESRATAAEAKLAAMREVLKEATEFVDSHSEKWYKSGQALLAKCRAELAK